MNLERLLKWRDLIWVVGGLAVFTTLWVDKQNRDLEEMDQVESEIQQLKLEAEAEKKEAAESKRVFYESQLAILERQKVACRETTMEQFEAQPTLREHCDRILKGR